MKFLRRTGHIVSMIMPLALIASGVLASSSTRQNTPHSSATAQASNNQQRGTNQPPPTLKGQPGAANANANASNNPANKNPSPVKWGAIEWSAIAQAASAVLVTVFTGVLVWYSHRGWTVAKKAADAAKQSAEGLKILNRQWVDFGDPEFEMSPIGPELKFIFTNKTKLPLTLTRFIVLTNSADALDESFGERLLLPDDDFRRRFEFNQTDAAGVWRKENRVVVDVVTAIYFIDAFGDPRRQLVGWNLVRQGDTGQSFISTPPGGVRNLWRSLLTRHPDIRTDESHGQPH